MQPATEVTVAWCSCKCSQ